MDVEERTRATLRLWLMDVHGMVIAEDRRQWLGAATTADDLALDRAVAPVLDIGCGPGRHLLALAGRGLAALGLDVTPSAVQLARSRGAMVLQGSIFGVVPASGTWGTALLLDGNIGIGGNPVVLLSRVGGVIRPEGRMIVELSPPGAIGRVARARLDHKGCLGPWFDWTTVGASSIEGIALAAGLEVSETWRTDGRWFARIERPRQASGNGRESHPAGGRQDRQEQLARP